MFITNVDNYLMICEYVYIFKYAIVALLISCLLFFLSVFAVYQKPEKEKMSVYECGFIHMVMLGINLKLSIIWLAFYLLYLI